MNSQESLPKSPSSSTSSSHKSTKTEQGDQPPADDFLCPVCQQVMKEAFMTRCGHSFCYACILKHLEHMSNCPVCSTSIRREDIFPNFSLNRLLQLASQTQLAGSVPAKKPNILKDVLHDNALSINDIDSLVGSLVELRQKKENNKKEQQFDQVLHFLNTTKNHKLQILDSLKSQIQFIENDISKVEEHKSSLRNRPGGHYVHPALSQLLNNDNTFPTVFQNQIRQSLCMPTGGSTPQLPPLKRKHDTIDSSTNEVISHQEANKRSRIQKHAEELQQCYFEMCTRAPDSALDDFSEVLSNFTQFEGFRVRATLKYGDIFNSSNIVSSIEFDRDDEYFATAGVTKKIKIFELSEIMSSTSQDITYPICELSNPSKLSCLCWNPYIKSQIASSDYDGTLGIWDVSTKQLVRSLEEHEKRVWSTHYAPADPTCLASGGDDAKLKIWNIKAQNSVMTIDAKANICTVRFNPSNSCHIAFGSADHHIFYYDLRNPREPLYMFNGHRKAVSYVKFLNANEIVSASTDSTLKLWGVGQNRLNTSSQGYPICGCIRTFHGHANSKNFVGLTVNNDYIACGSETNSTHVYYKGFTKPILSYKFPSDTTDTEEETSHFVSSLTWKKNTNLLVCANSLGMINIVEMV